MRGAAILIWSLIATIVLASLGIFGTLVSTGRITLFPTPTATPTPVVTAEPALDTTFDVIVLNATPQEGLARVVRDQVIAAGWLADQVFDSDAGSDDFAVTTIYYARAEDEGAARGLAQAIGGAEVVLNDAYQPEDDEATAEIDESAVRQLVIVIGLDRTDAGTQTPEA